MPILHFPARNFYFNANDFKKPVIDMVDRILVNDPVFSLLKWYCSDIKVILAFKLCQPLQNIINARFTGEGTRKKGV